MQEARDANVLHGPFGRYLLNQYEGHKGAVWMGRGYSAGILALIVGIIGSFLRWPLVIFWIPVGGGLAAAMVCFIIGLVHQTRWLSASDSAPPGTLNDPASSSEGVGDIDSGGTNRDHSSS